MRKIAERLLQVYVFTVPWETVADLPGLGPLARLSGLAAVGATVLAILSEGRFRKPNAVLGFAAVFVSAGVLSLLWAIPSSLSTQAIITYVQLLGSVWIVQELARTPEQRQRLLMVFCFGVFVPLSAYLSNFVLGRQVRYSGDGLGGPGIVPVLVIGIPIAFHLAMRCAGVVRAILVAYIPLALMVAPMTGGRTGFVAAIVSLAIMTFFARRSARSIVLLLAFVLVTPLALSQVLPQRMLDRMVGIPAEIASGDMTYRRTIWRVGLAAFPQHPLLGTGVGTYGAAVEELRQTFFNEKLVAHNVFIGILVEQGIVGLALFIALLGACGLTIFRMPQEDRRLWTILMLNWLTQAQAGSLERWKVTWLLFGLLAAQHAVESVHSRRVSKAADAPDPKAARERPAWAPSTGVAASSSHR
jgi:O-antigen ligase